MKYIKTFFFSGQIRKLAEYIRILPSMSGFSGITWVAVPSQTSEIGLISWPELGRIHAAVTSPRTRCFTEGGRPIEVLAPNSFPEASRSHPWIEGCLDLVPMGAADELAWLVVSLLCSPCFLFLRDTLLHHDFSRQCC